jgi:hypothetical protein
MFDIFYGNRNNNNRRLNRGFGGENVEHRCVCPGCSETVFVLASNQREAMRWCRKMGQNIGCNCTAMPPVQTGIRR